MSERGGKWYGEARRLRAKGLTCTQIGARFGISRQRVHQVVRAVEMPEYQGPQKPNISTSNRPLKGGRTKEPGYWDAQLRAHAICLAAIKRGEIVRQSQCEICGSTKRVDAHHEDYSKPLEIVWLCRRHHVRRHFDIARQTAARAEGVSLEPVDFFPNYRSGRSAKAARA